MRRSGDGLSVYDAASVRAALFVDTTISIMREAMIALSSGRVRQLLRSFIGLEPGRTFAIMPAAYDGRGVFGAKLVSVFTDDEGRKAHEGVVVLFDGETGSPVCVADAGAITELRTGAASAVATEVLSREDASVLAVLGAGKQAAAHIEAIARVRRLSDVRIWSRTPARADALAARMSALIGVPVSAKGDVAAAVDTADIVCTTTTAANPILMGAQVRPGTHVNLVGSSGLAAAEVDDALVAQSRFFVDHADHVRAHGAEYLRAVASGAIGEDHISAEIGEVLSGAKPGRSSRDEITVYKSLGHAAQDLAVAAWLYENVQ